MADSTYVKLAPESADETLEAPAVETPTATTVGTPPTATVETPSTASARVTPPMTPTPNGVFLVNPKRYRLQNAFFCLTTPTAVKLFGVLDLIRGTCALVLAGILLLARTHEHAIDKVVVEIVDSLPPPTYADANATWPVGSFHPGMTPSETAVAIAKMNGHIDKAAQFGVLALIVVAAIFYKYGSIGLKAVKDPFAAKHYYIWKLVHTFFTLLFGACGFFGVLFEVYATVVCRSHAAQLAEDAQQTLPVVHVVVRELSEQPYAPPQQQAKTLA